MVMTMTCQGQIKRFQHLTNIGSTKIERMLGKFVTNIELMLNGMFKRLQRHSTFSRAKEILNRC